MTDDLTTQDQPETQAEPGATPLKNARWEKFAHRLSWGVTQAQSYVLAGYPEAESNATNASRLAQKPQIVERVEWLKVQVANAHVYDRTRIVERLSTMFDALSEIRIDPDTGDRRPGPMFHAHSAARVGELLGREQGIFKDKIELGGNVSVGNTDMIRRMKPDDRTALKALLLGVQQQEPANDDNERPEEPQGGVVPVAK